VARVVLDGFVSEEQALAFVRWYEGGGEQAFSDHLDIIGMESRNGCLVDVRHKGNSGRYWDQDGGSFEVKLK